MKVTKSVTSRAMVYGATTAAMAAALLSGCGGGGSNSGANNTAPSDTFTRAFVPLNDGDKITYLATEGDGTGFPPYQIAAVVHGPAQTISDVSVPVMSVTYGFVSDGVPSYTDYQTTASTGFAQYGTDYFVDTSQHPQNPVTPPGGSRPLPQTGVSSAILQRALRYPTAREIPFGLTAGASTPVVSNDEILILVSNSSSFNPKQPGTQTYEFTNQGREMVTVPMGTFSCIKIKAEYQSFNSGTTTCWYAENIGLIKRFKQGLNYDNNNNLVIDKSKDFTQEAVSASIGGKQYP